MKHIQTFESFLNEEELNEGSKAKMAYDLYIFQYFNQDPQEGPKAEERKKWAEEMEHDPNNPPSKYISDWASLDRRGTFNALSKLRGSKDLEVAEFFMKMKEDMKKFK
jgi:hypothetical protein